MVQQVKVLAAEPDNLRSMPRTHMMEEGTPVSWFLTPTISPQHPHTPTHIYTHKNKQINVIKKILVLGIVAHAVNPST